MKIYKIAQISFEAWLSREIKTLTDNFKKPAAGIKYLIPTLRTWHEESGVNLEPLTIHEAVNLANDWLYSAYQEDKATNPVT